jgi:redox-sensitive bicupin YhaK (pirin superfamily)
MKSSILRTVRLPVAGPYPTLDPFLFCVYHVDNYPADPSGGRMEFLEPGDGHDFNPSAPYRMYHGDHVPGFPQHPHRGFETITATVDGLIDHADSAGNAGRYGEGDLQWMTAGKGIVHGEMFPLVNSDKPNPTKFFQLWLNLPAAKKMVDPSFAMFWAHDVPEWKSPDGLASVTVFTGDYFLDEDAKQNLPPPDSWAADPENDVAVLRIVVKPGGKMILPKANKGEEGVNRMLYLLEGLDGVKIDGRVADQKVCITLDASKDISLELPEEAQTATEFLVLQGRPIDEPVASHGPFVMNTQQEIRQAFYDYQKTRFGGWPWERDDMIFPQDKGRFSLMDGKETFPDETKQSEGEL